MFYLCIFIHGIGTCDFRTLNIFKGVCHDRLLNLFIKPDFHTNFEAAALFNSIGTSSFIINDSEICDLSNTASIFQHIGIYLKISQSFTVLCHNLLCTVRFILFYRILSYQKLFVQVNHLLW